MREVCIHGHFYQPTRENPWTGIIDAQPSAAPFLNWNTRITAECYAPNAAARLLDGERTRAVRNNYASLNFDFGPTLLTWMEEHQPVVLEGIRRADRDSIARFGRGSAMAQPYHHPILPLCDEADKHTEIAWGLACFARIFERPAEGMWLSETAVDTATLEVLVDHDVQYVIFAPHQIEAVRTSEADAWSAVSEEDCVNRAFRVPLPSGRTILAVVYDGLVSRGVAFDGLLHDGSRFADRLADAAKAQNFVLIATDGESYGHHHSRGEMALAYALEALESREDVRLTNVASWLERNPPQVEGKIREKSSWSCSHGIGRWSEDCGCKIDPGSGWHQRWRGPYRAALEFLRDESRNALEQMGSRLFSNPSSARDAYGAILRDPAAFEAWYAKWKGSEPDSGKALAWLEIHRHLLAMFTSCAWFFDEVTGIEPIQNLRHAGCAIGKLKALCGVDLTNPFCERLNDIPGNLGQELLIETIQVFRTAHPQPFSRTASLSSDDRCAGVLQPVSALGGGGPIGDLDGVLPFIDWLADAGVGLWQVLPLVPTDEGGSPYSSWSALSGNPDLVGLDGCRQAGLLPMSTKLETTSRVDYQVVRREKRAQVLQAARNLNKQAEHPWSADLARFERTATWANDAALFYALKTAFGEAPWWEWPENVRRADVDDLDVLREEHGEAISTWRTALFLFERQWASLRSVAAARGVRIVGDMPIYVGLDSVDVWLNQELFLLNDEGRPQVVAGVPPDAYSDVGQLWGNPLFDWPAMAADGYRWWCRRVKRMLEHCDALRIDHFIGFSRYWSIDADADDARGGCWNEGPGRPLFDALAKELGPLPLIAEDLGALDEGTERLRDDVGLPGMRVLQFGYDGDPNNPHHPSAAPCLSVVYPSTHDTSTARGWWEGLSVESRESCGLGTNGVEAAETMIDEALKAQSFWSILAVQDILTLGDDARMNVPGTVGNNWTWRQPTLTLPEDVARKLRARIERTGRLNVRT